MARWRAQWAGVGGIRLRVDPTGGRRRGQCAKGFRVLEPPVGFAEDYDVTGNGHRPVTLVLAAERSADAIKEALFAKRTVVWFDNLLIGRDEPLQALLHAGLVVESAIRDEDEAIVQVTLRNNTDATLQLRHLSTASQSLHRHAELVESLRFD